MTDQITRASERSDASASREILRLLRAGLISRELVELHAHLGHESALQVIPVTHDPSRIKSLCSDPSYGLAYQDSRWGTMVYIPEGVSVMGSDPKQDGVYPDETPQMLVHVPAYWIQQRPVTPGQWGSGQAVEGGDALVNVSWHDVQKELEAVQELPDDAYPVFRGGDWTEVKSWCRSAFRGRYAPSLRYPYLGFRVARSVEPASPDGDADRVIRGGSWNHASSWCRSAFRGRYTSLRRFSNLGFRVARSPDDHRYRLPTEDEWERAARGQDGRIYPWGDEWVPDRQTRRTLSSPWGVYDMSGEIWQWCQDAWRESRHE